ncbi:MAG: class I SAM-dependent methyltransferase [Clostridia bacterium]|nr:class I SAM-dependent methyltransferase [Clostridia bacterium]
MNTFNAIWEEVHQNQEWGKYPSEEVIRFIFRNFKNKKQAKILDIGCGAGAVTWFLAREGFDTFAFDGSETAVQRAAKRISEEGLKAKIDVFDAAKTGYEDEFFDGIVDSAMLYANNVQGIKAILKECCRVLKKDGKIFSTGLFKVGMTGYGTGKRLEEHTYYNIEEGPLAGKGTTHFFDLDQIISLWQEAGFKNMIIDSVDRSDLGGSFKVSYYMVQAQK